MCFVQFNLSIVMIGYLLITWCKLQILHFTSLCAVLRLIGCWNLL